MGRLPRSETKARLRVMARTTVDMERGTYEWPDDRPRVRPDGTPVVDKREILRVAGYDPKGGGGKLLFDDPYYLRQCAYQRAKRDNYLPSVIEEDGVDPERVLNLGVSMFLELEKRIAQDAIRGPDVKPNVTTNQLLVHSPAFIKLGLELRAREEGARESPKLGHLHVSLGDTIVGLDPKDRERYLEGEQQRQTTRMDTLRAIIDAQNASEENDNDPDVIDAEISAESS